MKRYPKIAQFQDRDSLLEHWDHVQYAVDRGSLYHARYIRFSREESGLLAGHLLHCRSCKQLMRYVRDTCRPSRQQ